MACERVRCNARAWEPAMKKILVAVDGSEPALHGVRLAGQLAHSNGAALLLAYISPPNLLPPHVYADVIEKLD